MLTVVGGSYKEVCLNPKWSQLFGSGLRAAAAVSEICNSHTGKPVKLITWISEEERDLANLMVANFLIDVDFQVRQNAIEFQYEHCLSSPRILPPIESIKPISPFSIEVENALIFGLLEDQRDVSAVAIKATGTVVYDPQAEQKAIPFSNTSMRANRLAIVANQTELKAMCNRLGLKIKVDASSAIELGKALLKAESASVVIVKNGAEGAFVITDTDAHHVESYQTKRVFKIGSGDIFSAVFAAYFCEFDVDPLEAAQRASAAAAYYCNRGGLTSLPLPSDRELLHDPGISPHRVPRLKAKYKPTVYLAGPIFSLSDQWFVQEVYHFLKQHGVTVFSPFHEVGLAAHPLTKEEITRVANADIVGLEKSASVFAILDGLDSGTLFEVGYAASKKIPVVCYATQVDSRDLLMIEGNEMCTVFSDFATAIYHAAWKALES